VKYHTAAVQNFDFCEWPVAFGVLRCIADYREIPRRKRLPGGVELNAVVHSEPSVKNGTQESSTSNPNELLALLPEHCELESAAPTESSSWWRWLSHLFHLDSDFTIVLGLMWISRKISPPCFRTECEGGQLRRHSQLLSQMILHSRGHSFAIPRVTYETTKRSFLMRCL